VDVSAAAIEREAGSGGDQIAAVPPGYKRTAVGVIPEDWEVKTLGALGQPLSGGTPPTSDVRFWGGDIPWVSSKDMKVARLRDSIDHVTPLAIGNGTRLVQPGTILMVVRGMSLAHSFPVAVAERPIAFNQDLKALVLRPSVSSEFILRWLEANQQAVLLLATEATHGTKRIPTGDLLRSAVPLPPPREQRAIAEALSDADGLIGGLEALITKKRAIRQAVMQQLLTRKTRLPGFSGEWQEVPLLQVADKQLAFSFAGGPFGSNLKASEYTQYGVRIIQLQNIGDGRFNDEYAIYTSEAKADELKSCNIFPGEIIISKMGDPVARACMVPACDRRYLMASDGIRLAVDRQRFCTRFVHDYINSPEFRSKAVQASTGSTRMRIGLGALRRLPIRAPELAEQEGIATVLSEMDAEIAALERRRDKTRAIKQGMMPQLLTGRVRLVKPPQREATA
jgi:type I restriction enzyme S subunit